MSTIRLRWNRDADGCLDRYGRDAARCRAEAQVASDLAAVTRGVVDEITAGRVTLGREAGPRLVSRYLLNAELLEAIAHRDQEAAVVMERANAEELRRRGGWGAPLTREIEPQADEVGIT